MSNGKLKLQCCQCGQQQVRDVNSMSYREMRDLMADYTCPACTEADGTWDMVDDRILAGMTMAAAVAAFGMAAAG